MKILNLKRLKLTAFFAIYHIFTPFIFVNCGSEDVPYIKVIGGTTDLNDECFTDEFLTADCQKYFDENPDAVAPEDTEAATTI